MGVYTTGEAIACSGRGRSVRRIAGRANRIVQPYSHGGSRQLFGAFCQAIWITCIDHPTQRIASIRQEESMAARNWKKVKISCAQVTDSVLYLSKNGFMFSAHLVKEHNLVDKLA